MANMHQTPKEHWMRRFALSALVISAAALLGGCPTFSGERNPFVPFVEQFGLGQNQTDDTTGGSGTGTSSTETFRSDITLTLVNHHPAGDLNTSVLAWVNVSSIRSADQQDALLRDGYVQLTRSVQIGSIATLQPGTFVFNGTGFAGAIPILVDADEGGTGVAETLSFTVPDTILVFSQPPVSCDSVAFFFTDDDGDLVAGSTIDVEGSFAGATLDGPQKTLAQVDVYQCDPLRPGLFLKAGGGARQPNEFFEGENIQIDFFEVPDADGNAAIVNFIPR
jgi:hypothetical protein